MGVIIIDTLQRGGSGVSEFAVARELDLEVSYLTVADTTARDAIPEWKRLPYMRVHSIGDNTDYRLGSDVTIVGQVWTSLGAGGGGVYQLLSEKGQPDGYVPLNSLTKIDASYISDIYSNNSYVAASAAAMFALSTQTGDIVTRTDTSQIFVKLNNNPPPTLIGDFAELLFPGAVLSVNGMVGAVSIDFNGLLAWASNQTEFDTAVSNNSTVLGNAAQISTNIIDISTLFSLISSIQSDIAALGGTITDYNNGASYVVGDYVVYAIATNLELYKCIQASGGGNNPTDPLFWQRIGDYYTQAEIDALLANKADLVGGVIPLTQIPPEVFAGTIVVADIAARDAYPGKVEGMRFYVIDASADPAIVSGGAEYVYSPLSPGADPAGFILVNISTLPEVNNRILYVSKLTGDPGNSGLNSFQPLDDLQDALDIAALEPAESYEIIFLDTGFEQYTGTHTIAGRTGDISLSKSVDNTFSVQIDEIVYNSAADQLNFTVNGRVQVTALDVTDCAANSTINAGQGRGNITIVDLPPTKKIFLTAEDSATITIGATFAQISADLDINANNGGAIAIAKAGLSVDLNTSEANEGGIVYVVADIATAAGTLSLSNSVLEVGLFATLNNTGALVSLDAFSAIKLESGATYNEAGGSTEYNNPASQVGVDTSGFSGNLSASDDTAQKAFDTLDGLSTGSAVGGGGIYYDTSAAGGGDGSPAKPFNTWSAAIIAATTNSTIYVVQDSSENISLTKQVKLIGLGKRGTTGNDYILLSGNISININGCVLDGFFINTNFVATQRFSMRNVQISSGGSSPDFFAEDCIFGVGTWNIITTTPGARTVVKNSLLGATWNLSTTSGVGQFEIINCYGVAGSGAITTTDTDVELVNSFYGGNIVQNTDTCYIRNSVHTGTQTGAGSFVEELQSGGGGHVIEDEGTPLAQQTNLNFVGDGVTAADSGGKTVVTIPGSGAPTYGTPITHSASGALAIDLDDGHRVVTLEDDITALSFTNGTAGITYTIQLTQDSTGGWTMVLGTGIYREQDLDPVLSLDADAIDVLYVEVIAASTYLVSWIYDITAKA